ncbi:hypothetical protein D0Z07_6728 [Hyphodiscus hymeniophilus]|uniref:2EXR domain-containing protein n=1 Tax=Hyphodiscus hymeniophilus TaxID=353542 RepID=A0A9P7AVN2_9HELO|nr:hypothetical protein D0Z07_6728 [Hyphodiscus hymeniophilus]
MEADIKHKQQFYRSRRKDEDKVTVAVLVRSINALLALEWGRHDTIMQGEAATDLSSDSLKTASLDSFPQFKKLPLELRLQIWNAALPGPRVVRVRTRPIRFYNRDYDSDNIEAMMMHAFFSCTSPPTILFVNRESREEAQLTYKLAFGCQKLDIPNMVYFNFELDTLYFEGSSRSGIRDLQLTNFVRAHNVSLERFGADQVQRVALRSIMFSENIGQTHSSMLHTYANWCDQFHSASMSSVREVLLPIDASVPVGTGIQNNSVLVDIDRANAAQEFPIMHIDHICSTGCFIQNMLLPSIEDWEMVWRVAGEDQRNDLSFIPQIKVVKVVHLAD